MLFADCVQLHASAGSRLCAGCRWLRKFLQECALRHCPGLDDLSSGRRGGRGCIYAGCRLDHGGVVTAADGGLWAAAVAAGSCGGACVRGAQRWLRSCGRRAARSFARCCCSRRSRWLAARHTTMSDDGPSQACSGWVGAPPPRAGDARTCVRGAQRGMRCCGRQTAGGARRHGSRWPAGPRRQRASATLVGHPTVDRAVLVAGRRRAAAGRQLRRRVPATHVRALLRTAGGGRRALPLAARAGAAGTRAVDEVAEELVGSGACVDGQ